MITKIYYTDGSTYIDDDKGVTIRTDDLSVQQAMQLAFDTLSLFEIDVWADQWVLRQAIKAFKDITNTKTFLDCYSELALHIFNDNVLKGFRFDITDGIPQLFDLLLNQEYEHGYKDIDNDLIEQYVKDYIADSLDSYMADNNRTDKEIAIAEKYYSLFRDVNSKFCDIQHQIFCDNEALYQSKIIQWIDVDYCTHRNHMVLLGYNPKGEEVFSKLIEDVTQEQAEETYNNIFNGMQSSDIYYD